MSRRRRRIRRVLAFGGIVVLIAIAVVGFQGWKIVSALVEAEKSVVVPLPTRSADVALGGAASNNSEKPQITPGSTDTVYAESDGDGAPPAAPTEAPQVVLQAEGTTTPVINVTVEVTQTPAVPLTSTPAPTNTVVGPTPTPVGGSSAPRGPTPTATEEAQPTFETAAEPGSSPSPGVIATLESDGTGGPDSEPEQAPVSTPVPEPTVAPAAVPSPTPTAPPTDAATPVANGASGDSSGDDGDSPSRLDIVRQVLGQGFNSGDPATSEVWGGKTTLNILVIGLDRRPEGGDQNADVIIIAQLDLIDHQMRAVSIPRDLLVDVPGFGYDKINSAYNHGIAGDATNTAAGVGLVRDTIEYNFGVPIDDYVLIDFGGFTDVVDAVGGISVDVPYDIYDPEYPTSDYGTEELHFPAGETEMDGDTALKYVRTRHADSDDQRRERQLQVLRAIFAKGQELGSLSKIDNMILALGDSAQTSFPLEQQLTLARLALEMDESDITLSSLAPPLITGGTIDTGAWVYSGDMTAISQFVQDAVNGTGQTFGGGAG